MHPRPSPPGSAAPAGLGGLLGFLRTGDDLSALPGSTLPDGTRIGRPIGFGGMCAVFDGARADGSACAVKVLLPAQAAAAEARRRFERESRILLARAIPGLPRGIGAGVHAGLPYILMERVAGRTLADEMRACGRLDPARAVDLVARILEVLHRVHRGGIVHRDLKPENVLLREGGSLCLIDFGVAKLEAAAGSPESADGLTRQGEFLGTPPYSAPEQTDDARRATRESDLFSTGVILLEMLTGRTLAEKPRAVRGRQARALIELEGLPERLGRVVERALHEQPRRRFHRARAMAAALTGRFSPTAWIGWILDRPAAVISFQLGCVALVLAVALVRAGRHEQDLEAALADARRAEAESRARNVRLAEERALLLRENQRLHQQHSGPLQQLLHDDLREKYRALLRASSDPDGRERKKFLVAAESLLGQTTTPSRRAEVESMRAAVAARTSARAAEIRVVRGNFPTVWADVPDTRARVVHNGRVVGESARIDDRNDPEFGLSVRLDVRPYDTILVEIEEGDLGWESLLRIDSTQSGQRLDPIAGLHRLAGFARAHVELVAEYFDPPPPLPDPD